MKKRFSDTSFQPQNLKKATDFSLKKILFSLRMITLSGSEEGEPPSPTKMSVPNHLSIFFRKEIRTYTTKIPVVR